MDLEVLVFFLILTAIIGGLIGFVLDLLGASGKTIWLSSMIFGFLFYHFCKWYYQR